MPIPVEICFNNGIRQPARADTLEQFDGLTGTARIKFWDAETERWQDSVIALEDISYVRCIPWPDKTADSGAFKE